MYVAIFPNVVPAVSLTLPLAGLVREPQSTTVEGKNTSKKLENDHTSNTRYERDVCRNGQGFVNLHPISHVYLICIRLSSEFILKSFIFL